MMSSIPHQTESSSSRKKELPNSPVNVIDFSPPLEIDAVIALTKLHAPNLKNPSIRLTGNLPRMKDSETAPSFTDEEDEVHSFCSSISSHSGDLEHDNDIEIVRGKAKGGFEAENCRRSIFSHYWKTTGQEPLELIREHETHNMTRSPSNADLSTLDVQKTTPLTPENALVSLRRQRSIFSTDRNKVSFMRSLPELSAIAPSAMLETSRKTQSLSQLQFIYGGKLPSCLRMSSTLSSSKCTQPKNDCSSSSLVSFDAKVQVITYYQPPLDPFSDSSRSNLFGV